MILFIIRYIVSHMILRYTPNNAAHHLDLLANARADRLARSIPSDQKEETCPGTENQIREMAYSAEKRPTR